MFSFRLSVNYSSSRGRKLSTRVYRLLSASCLLLMAMRVLAGAYEDGIAAYDRAEYAAALQLWLPLAEQGHRAAQFNVAVLYEKGLGTPIDQAAAAGWYLKAARQGDPEAQFNVGLYFEAGIGVDKDPERARTWFSQVLANARADAPLRTRAREHLLALTKEESIAFEGGRFVIAKVNESECLVALQGVIGRDTAVKFDEVVSRTQKVGCPRPWLMLESPGGKLDDGLALAKEVHFGSFRTITRFDCASACSLIFLAGSERVLVGSRARIGFHEAAVVRGGAMQDRFCSDGFDREMHRYLRWVIPEHAEEVMRVIRSTSCKSIEWTSGARALELGVATRLDADNVDVFGATPTKR